MALHIEYSFDNFIASYKQAIKLSTEYSMWMATDDVAVRMVIKRAASSTGSLATHLLESCPLYVFKVREQCLVGQLICVRA